MKYEICFLVGEANEVNLEDIKKSVEETVAKENGSFYGSEFIDKRKLAYPIAKNIRGTYVAKRFEVGVDDDNASGDFIARIVKAVNLIPGILRCLIVKADELPEIKTREEMMARPAMGSSKPTKVAPKEIKKETLSQPAVKNESIDQQLDEILNI